MFESLSAKFQGAFASLRSKGRLKPGDIDEIASEIRSALLDSDVALSVVDFFIEQLKSRTDEVLTDLNKSTNPANAISSFRKKTVALRMGIRFKAPKRPLA